jgi:hypothetical protein
MRITLVILVNLFCIGAFGQKIEYRHDSLYVNNYFVDAQISKVTLDSLLGAISKTKTSKDDYTISPVTGKKVIRTTYFYYDLGLFFRKYNHDISKLSIGIKLYRDNEPKKDKESELKETFRGQLFIAENLINDKRKIEQLKKMENCTVTASQATLGSYSMLIGGDIFYEKNVIRLSFDSKTSELKEVFIHHNFKDR